MSSKSSRQDKVSFPAHIKIISGNDNKKFNCEFCKKTFKSRNQIYYHLYCDDIDKSPYKCEKCNKAFLSAYHLNYHQQTHEESKQHTCEICKKTFSRLQTLNRHMKEHENSIKYHECNKCDAKFKDKTAYLGHIQKHDNIFLYSCDECNKNFTIKSNFKQHLLIHSQKPNFKCDKCSKTFSRKNSYNIHLLRHTDQRNFFCTKCSKTFIDKKTLDRHQTVHKDQNERILYKCSLCGIRSKRKDNLIRHLRNVHPDDAKSRNDTIEIEKGGDISNDQSSTQVDSNTESDQCNEVTKSNPNTICIPEKNTSTNEIIYNSSVIRSIGNVEPVYIPNVTSFNATADLRSSQIDPMKLSSDQQNSTATMASNGDTVYTNTNFANTSSKTTTTTAVPPKKTKKKYDPCEIYRKILLASNDEDSEDINIEEHSSSCCEESTAINNIPPITAIDNHIESIENDKKSSLGKSSTSDFLSNSNFAEVHWRKRTSQYFLNM